MIKLRVSLTNDIFKSREWQQNPRIIHKLQVGLLYTSIIDIGWNNGCHVECFTAGRGYKTKFKVNNNAKLDV